jgi:hypothetical protein
MHISFTAHNASNSASSSNLIEYLEKENQSLGSNEQFFNSEYSAVNPIQDIDTSLIASSIDNNRGSQNYDSSNFYMLNISPSASELSHMDKLAVEELEYRGLDEESNRESLYYREQKEELMKMQMKLYTKDVMNEYASNFGREIYSNEGKLPNAFEKKALGIETEKAYEQYLKENGIDLESKEETKSKEWIEVNNIQIKEQKGKSILVQMDLGKQGKAEIFIPKSTLHLQENGSYKLPEDLYKAKALEVINKNTLTEIKAVFKGNSKLRNEENVFNFSVQDKRFKEPLKLSFNEKDLTVAGGKYFVSKHLLNEKNDSSLKKAIDQEFGNEKDAIYKNLATNKGFDLSTRALTGEDLLWYGKIELSRSYKHDDKFVLENKKILKEITLLEKENGNTKAINNLRENLRKDKITGKIIEGGYQKGGLQLHAHVVVSRHDKTMKNSRNKISLSPLANAKESITQHGEKIGFDRTVFFQKGEQVFDKKFEYDRPKEQTFNHYNQEKKEMKSFKNEISGRIQGKVKQFVMKHTGLSEVKQQISPVAAIKQELGIIANIPTGLPKGGVDLVFKVVKSINNGMDMGY